MSFILDALKKLEQKRQHGSVPDLLTVHDSMPQESKNRPLWPYLLLVALLLNAGILAVWLRPWQSEKPNVATQSTDRQPHESTVIQSHLPASAPSTGLAKTISPEAKATEEESSKTVATSTANGVNNVPQDQPVQTEADVQRKVPSEPAPITPPTAESQTSADIGVESEQRVLNIDELPLSVQQDLPDLTITGHIYSNNPTYRIVNINGQITQEGQAVTAGLKLEEITPSGVIFSYKGYRFRIRGF